MSQDCRSHNGCWTCRVRRKKCDESAMPCKSCAGLRLTCHGYGPKPEWMDGGTKEKAKVLELKATVKRNLKQRRQSRTGVRLSAASSLSDVVMGDAQGATVDEEEEEIRVHNPLPTPLSPIEGPVFCFSPVPFPPDNTSKDPFESMFPSDGLEEYVDIGTFQTFQWESRGQEIIHKPGGPVGVVGSPEDPFSSGSATSTDSSHDRESSTSSLTSTNQQLLAQWTNDSSQTDLADEDRNIIDSYLQNSLTSQIPLSEDRTSTVFASQLSTLAARSKPCLEALALHSSCCKSFALRRLGICNSPSIQGDGAGHKRSTEEFIRDSLARFEVTASVEASSERENLLALEAQVCVAQAIHSNLICRSPEWYHGIGALGSLRPLNYDQVCSGDFNRLGVFQALLISIDIIASTTTGSSPKFALKFDDDLNEGSMRVESVVGCRSDVMRCIMHISELRAWSYQQSSNASSSLIETARRALKVEQELEEAWRRNNTDTMPSSQSRAYVRDDEVRAVTNIYTHAASIYLHVTVSGARPRVPEIKRGVTKTMEAVACIPRAETIDRLAWPICISACMAEGEDRRFFDALERGVKDTRGNNHQVVRAIAIAKECWRLRDTQNNSFNGRVYDWKDGMASLDEKVLLL